MPQICGRCLTWEEIDQALGPDGALYPGPFDHAFHEAGAFIRASCPSNTSWTQDCAPTGGGNGGTGPPPTGPVGGGGDILAQVQAWIQANPLPAVGIAALIGVVLASGGGRNR